MVLGSSQYHSSASGSIFPSVLPRTVRDTLGHLVDLTFDIEIHASHPSESRLFVGILLNQVCDLSANRVVLYIKIEQQLCSIKVDDK